MKRPASTVAGAVLVLLRVLAGVMVITVVLLGWDAVVGEVDVVLEGVAPDPQLAEGALAIIVIALGGYLVVEAVLAFFILSGHNWARVIVMAFSAISITTSFIQWWAEGLEIRIATTLLSVGLDILILLALSSRSAAAYARRNERP